MKNAFDPAEETERDWDIELRDDVKGEVEDKYGKVAEIFVLKDSQVSTKVRKNCLRLIPVLTQCLSVCRERFTSGLWTCRAR
jgi:hypothetical protein